MTTVNRLTFFEAALPFATAAYPVLALTHPVKDKATVRCSCGKAGCDKAGKHPNRRHGTFKNGHNSATCDLDAIAKFSAKEPDANIGVRTGAESGLIVLDVDPRADGDSSLERLSLDLGIQFGEPSAYSGMSDGSRGRHFYFRHPGGYVRSRPLGDYAGLDFKGDSGYIVAPPSLHRSGVRYEFGPRGVDILMDLPFCPDELLRVLREQGVWQPATPKTADIGVLYSEIVRLILTTPSNHVRQFGGELVDEFWARELLNKRGPASGMCWLQANFRPSSGNGQRFRHAQHFAGHLYRYGATVDEAEALARHIAQNALSHDRLMEHVDGPIAAVSFFISTVDSLYKGLLRKADFDLNDFGEWRIGKAVLFPQEMLERMKKMTPCQRAMLYALECIAQRAGKREICISQLWFKTWLGYATGAPKTGWDASKLIEVFTSPRTYAPARDAILEKLSDDYRIGKHGKLYRLSQPWTEGKLSHHLEAEKLLGLPSFFDFEKRWLAGGEEMCYFETAA